MKLCLEFSQFSFLSAQSTFIEYTESVTVLVTGNCNERQFAAPRAVYIKGKRQISDYEMWNKNSDSL